MYCSVYVLTSSLVLHSGDALHACMHVHSLELELAEAVGSSLHSNPSSKFVQ